MARFGSWITVVDHGCDCMTCWRITFASDIAPCVRREFHEMPRPARGPMDKVDQELMDRLCAGETECLGDLYDRHSRGVLRHCTRMVGDSHVARDLTQEVFLRVLRYRMSWEGRARFTTWLYRITRNVCLDHLKREKRRLTVLDVGLHDSDAGPEVVPDDVASGMERRESAARLQAALGRLRPAHREIILLIRYQDLSYEEVSRVLGCTVNAARVRFHRALTALKDEYIRSGRTEQ